MIYLQFIRFLLPLMLTMIVQEFSGQVLHGGIARIPQATETLASYGLAWGWATLLFNPLMQVRQLGLVLADSQQAFKKIHRFVVLAGLVLAGVLASCALDFPGMWVIEKLHGLTLPLSTRVRELLFWFIPIPLFKGLNHFYAGLLMRVRRTDIISYAILTGIGVSIVSVFVLLPVGFVQERPIRLPIMVAYAGILSELGMIFLGYKGYVVGRLPEETGNKLTFSYIIRFFWPLALIMGVQASSRPLINLFISRGTNGAEALAVLTVVYSLGHLPYGWLNEIRNLPSAFKDKLDNLNSIRWFAINCGLISFGVMVILFWTPLREFILGTLIGLEPGLAAHCAIPLVVFSFFPLVVMARAYFHGVGLLERRTQSMAPSAPSRIVAILAALTFLLTFKMHGATRGIVALLSGFIIETLVVWRGIRSRSKTKNNY